MLREKRLLFPLLCILGLIVLITTNACALARYQNEVIEQPKVIALPAKSVDFLTEAGQAMAKLAETVKPAVVNISTLRTETVREAPQSPLFNDPFFRRFFGDRFRQQEGPREWKSMSLGSGVIVSPDGFILTNYHLVKNADKIRILLSDKREFPGRIVGTDPKTDLSVIKIDAMNLFPATLGNSDALKVGEFVLAVGNPFGLNQTITMGIVSAVGRANVGIAEYEDFIQTDAAINPGNSGGALVNVNGELIGINTAIFSTTGGYQGIGFAIPSNMAKSVMQSLIKKGKVVRGWFGVSVQPVTPELARQFLLPDNTGTLISDVVQGGPAAQAGLMRGDVIIAFNGKRVDEPYILRNLVAGTPPGEEIELTVIREGQTFPVRATIGELPSETQEAAETQKNPLRGVLVQNLTPVIYQQLELPEKMRGVVVTKVESGTPAETVLVPGDVIVEINRKAVASVEDYQSVASALEPDSDVLLLVYRRGSTVFLTISQQ